MIHICTLAISAATQQKVPKDFIDIPPGKPWAGILIAFLVPHFTVNSFVLTNKTSALIPLLNPNLNTFNIDKKGIISDSISKLTSSLNIPYIFPLYIKIAS